MYNSLSIAIFHFWKMQSDVGVQLMLPEFHFAQSANTIGGCGFLMGTIVTSYSICFISVWFNLPRAL
jgi:hypothetical protein